MLRLVHEGCQCYLILFLKFEKFSIIDRNKEIITFYLEALSIEQNFNMAEKNRPPIGNCFVVAIADEIINWIFCRMYSSEQKLRNLTKLR